ncbi:MAG: hypothetical protein ACTSUV_02355 [Candidatus Ranarchaeia archaeon]
MVNSNWHKVCLKCGSKNLEQEELLTRPPGFGMQEGKVIVSLEGVGKREVWSSICADCGNMEIYIKGSIEKERIKKIVYQLQKEFEMWPKKDQISISELARKVKLRKQELMDLLKEVKREYPQFSVETIGNEKYLRKYQDFK